MTLMMMGIANATASTMEIVIYLSLLMGLSYRITARMGQQIIFQVHAFIVDVYRTMHEYASSQRSGAY